MATIQTRYHGPTNTRGARISAFTPDGQKVTIPYDHGASDSHEQAFLALCRKLGWEGEWHCGGSIDRRGNVYVQSFGKPIALTWQLKGAETMPSVGQTFHHAELGEVQVRKVHRDGSITVCSVRIHSGTNMFRLRKPTSPRLWAVEPERETGL